MRKVAIIFVIAVFLPSLVLAWLAVRSLRDQQFVLERQRSLLYQGVTDGLARTVTDYLADRQREFNAQVESLAATNVPRAIAAAFDELIRTNWPLAEVGFSVTVSGNLIAPTAASRPAAREFYAANCSFLGNQESAEVYSVNNVVFIPTDNNASQQVPALASAPLNLVGDPGYAPAELNQGQMKTTETMTNLKGSFALRPVPNKNVFNFSNVQKRKVNPIQQQAVGPNEVPPAEDQLNSRVVPAAAEFAQLVGDAHDGTIARFLQNKLKLMFWHRSDRDPQLVFGAQLDLARVTESLRALVNVEPALAGDICVALLDDSARPVAISAPGFRANWKRPFVATEIGEALPHWEAAVYLRDPVKLTQSARSITLTLGLLIAVLLLAIGVGGWLIVNDLNRQLTLARQKTDFVSNVSHELKTPLTSIRMFSELLADERVTDPAKQRSYLNIITAEAARLTRLINNVLDFSRLERGEKKYRFEDCDLVQVARDTACAYRPHLENHGFQFHCTLPEYALRIRGDADALAQILVNLLSNAEKYSGDHKEIVLEAGRRDGPLPCAEVRVLDRGVGVPRGSGEKIFEKFYRAHDSLSSGIQGSGLGLTLARQIARAHGGDVFYEARDGGGSCFCLRLPLVQRPENL